MNGGEIELTWNKMKDGKEKKRRWFHEIKYGHIKAEMNCKVEESRQ